MIAVTIGHACPTGLTARQTWPLARLSFLFLALSLPPPLSRCTPACTECTLLHVAPPTRTLPMYHLSTCATVRNCSPLCASFSSSSRVRRPFCSSPLFFPPSLSPPPLFVSSVSSRRSRSSLHLDSLVLLSFLSRSCCPFAPIHLPCTSFVSFLFFSFLLFFLFRFDSSRGYIEFFCLHLRGRFLLASLSRFIIVSATVFTLPRVPSAS